MLLCVPLSPAVFVSTFMLTNEAGERAEQEDVSAVKWLSGYVNAGRRQEHSEDTVLTELEKNMRHRSKSISIDLLQRHDLPIATQCQRHITTPIHTHTHTLSNKHNPVWADEKKKYIHVYFTRRAHFFCTNCKLNTVIILRVIIFDITFMNEHQKHVNK